MSFLKQALSDNGIPSSSRLLTLVHSLTACGCLIFVVIKNHDLPDGMTLTGLGAFATAAYVVNRASTAFGKDRGSKDITIPKV
jgi:hypothetical protein